jgi:pilus assembly protein CpaB
MKRAGLLLIVIGLALAVFSALSVVKLTGQRQVATPTPVPTVRVVVATQLIPERTALQAAMLATKEWPANLVPPGALINPQDAVGKISIGMIVPGEVILATKITLEEQTVGLAPVIPPGLVAIAISLQSVQVVGGAVRVGDTVDIMVSVEYSAYNERGDESKPQHTTFYTIQDVPVLRVSGPPVEASGSTQSSASVSRSSTTLSPNYMLTVLVTPQDALLLKYAREKGTIDVALRSSQFHDQVTTDPVYLEYIIRRFELPEPLLIQRQIGAGEAQ